MMKLAILCLSLLALPARSAVLFDAADDIIGFDTMGDNVFRENQVFSFSCWFFAISDGEASAGVFIRRGGCILRITGTQGIRFSVSGATTLLRIATDGSFELDEWNHLAVTWDGSVTAANVHIYINGAELSYTSTTDGLTPADNSADSVVIGNNTTLSNTFHGQLSDVFVSSAVFTAKDIENLSKSRIFGMPIMCSTATGTGWAYWPLWDLSDGATVTGTIRDFSGNGYHGAATNSPVAVASVVITGP